MDPGPTSAPELALDVRDSEVVVRLAGSWSWPAEWSTVSQVEQTLTSDARHQRLGFDTTELATWDGSLLSLVLRIEKICDARGVVFDATTLPRELQRARRVVRGEDADQEDSSEENLSTLEGVGEFTLWWLASLDDKLAFLGHTASAVVRLCLGRTRNVGVRFTLALQEAGVEMLPIIGLIAFLMGGVLTLLGAQQLEKVVGARLLVPNLVAIVIFRELGALMSGIALAGRVASAHAADFATMMVNGDVTAIEGLGFDRFDLVVAPRVLALMLMGPMLVLYASAFALLGGYLVGVNMMGISSADYLDRALDAINVKHTIAGLTKGVGFGFAVAMAGAYYGLRSGRRPGDVGRAAKTGVVAAVLAVVLLDTALTLFFKWVKL